jgi:hypothetical protein
MLEMVLSFLAEIGLLITQKLMAFLKKRIASAVSALITDIVTEAILMAV